MGRLIDANALEKTMYSVADLSCSETIHVNVIADIIGNAPTVDAVPVVRCKDCKYWKTGEGVNRSKKVKFCTYHIWHRFARRDEDFCSRGERKDGDHYG